MFKIKVAGEYVVSGKLAQIEYYESEFELTEGHEGKARAIIQNGLLSDKLRKTLNNYKRWRTCEIVDIKEIIDKADKEKAVKSREDLGVDDEIEELLTRATDLGCLPVNYGSYKSNAVRKRRLREAIEKKEATVKRLKRKQGNEELGGCE